MILCADGNYAIGAKRRPRLLFKRFVLIEKRYERCSTSALFYGGALIGQTLDGHVLMKRARRVALLIGSMLKGVSCLSDTSAKLKDPTESLVGRQYLAPSTP